MRFDLAQQIARTIAVFAANMSKTERGLCAGAGIAEQADARPVAQTWKRLWCPTPGRPIKEACQRVSYGT